MTIIKTADLKVGDIIRSSGFACAVRDGHGSFIASEAEFPSYCERLDEYATALFVVYSVYVPKEATATRRYRAIRLPQNTAKPLLHDLILEHRDHIWFIPATVPEVEKVGELTMEVLMTDSKG